ncbi:MAG: acetate kinase [Lentisphaerae bacterium]|nr:acetate kinase [Lentisphaerota bacterium]
MKILVFNCGSSSIKYQLFEMPDGTICAKGLVQRIGEKHSEAFQKCGDAEIRSDELIENHQHGLQVIRKMLTDPDKGPIKSMSEIAACGHRVVHGGESFTGSMEVDDEVEKVIENYSDLAPLHNPPNLTGIREAKKTLGDKIPQIACFDTAFHQTIPNVAYLYGLPYDMYEKYKIRRYGFHGTSHRYVARRAAKLMNMDKYDADLITCHLGNGCSIAAVKAGKSIDTSMGLTPLEGVMMGTRTGDFDPAIIFYLNRKGYSSEDLDKIFNKKSGLLGLSGISNDVRDLEAKAESGDTRARLALDVFAYRIRKYIGAYLAVLNGCHGIVFTGGIGENEAKMRCRIVENMENLGIRLDDKKNASIRGTEGSIEADNSKIRLLVVPTDEEGAIANDTYNIVSGGK